MSQKSMRLIRVGHSPDADDAFMFYALAHKKIPMRGFQVEHVIEDIESLNQRALTQVDAGLNSKVKPGVDLGRSLEVTAVSCHAYAYLADRYIVMRSGASVGDGYGPILVTKKSDGGKQMTKDTKPGLSSSVIRHPFPVILEKIAIPGKLTTAYLVLQLFLKEVFKSWPVARGPEFVFVPFDKIPDAVKNGEVDGGLLIHEGQITYEDHGLEKVVDLGEWWHEKTKLPLPLGVDVIRRDLGLERAREFSLLFRESIEYALNHRKEALEYALRFGRGVAPELNDRFVGMYVNDRTVDIGPDGEAGFRRLLDMAFEHGLISHKIKFEFI